MSYTNDVKLTKRLFGMLDNFLLHLKNLYCTEHFAHTLLLQPLVLFIRIIKFRTSSTTHFILAYEDMTVRGKNENNNKRFLKAFKVLSITIFYANIKPFSWQKNSKRLT